MDNSRCSTASLQTYTDEKMRYMVCAKSIKVSIRAFLQENQHCTIYIFLKKNPTHMVFAALLGQMVMLDKKVIRDAKPPQMSRRQSNSLRQYKLMSHVVAQTPTMRNLGEIVR